MPAAWYLAVAVSQGQGKIDYILKIINFAYIPAATAAILLSASRGSFVATLPAFLFILWSLQQIRFHQKALIFIALILGLYAIQSFIPQSSFDRLATIDDSLAAGDLAGRAIIWREGLDVFAEHPVFGVGAGAFRAVVGRSSHNSYLSVLVQLGIIGFALFAIILVIVIHSAIKQQKWESRLWLATIVILALGNFVHNWDYRKATWLVLILVVVSANVSVHLIESGQLTASPQAQVSEMSFLSSLPKRPERGQATPSQTSGPAPDKETK